MPLILSQPNFPKFLTLDKLFLSVKKKKIYKKFVKKSLDTKSTFFLSLGENAAMDISFFVP